MLMSLADAKPQNLALKSSKELGLGVGPQLAEYKTLGKKIVPPCLAWRRSGFLAPTK